MKKWSDLSFVQRYALLVVAILVGIVFMYLIVMDVGGLGIFSDTLTACGFLFFVIIIVIRAVTPRNHR